MSYPFVSICTPTFNRRPFFSQIINCFLQQDYPKERMEWIIIDDGTDKIKDMLSSIKQVKYFPYKEKMFLGKKRNLMHQKAKGDIIIYMDDDDYYPPTRVSHAVTMLQQNPSALCAGTSEMHIYFKHIGKMVQFGPYGPSHATAATFAFRKELLLQTQYNDEESIAEERHFLKGYSIPFIQLDPVKTILVFSHIHNSFDKKEMLDEMPTNPFIKYSSKTVNDFILLEDANNIFAFKKFFLDDIENILEAYEPGDIKYKPEVTDQIKALREKRNKMMEDNLRKTPSQPDSSVQLMNQTKMIQELLRENNELKSKNAYLNEKITMLINRHINQKELKGKQL